jgi:hypothetical protein
MRPAQCGLGVCSCISGPQADQGTGPDKSLGGLVGVKWTLRHSDGLMALVPPEWLWHYGNGGRTGFGRPTPAPSQCRPSFIGAARPMRV